MSAEVIGYLVNLLGVISSALEIYFYVLVKERQTPKKNNY